MNNTITKMNIIPQIVPNPSKQLYKQENIR